MNNFDRILQEIRQQASSCLGDARCGSDGSGAGPPGRGGLPGMTPDVLVRLLIEMVDLEDQHRVKARSINQEIKKMLRSVADDLLDSSTRGEG